LRGREIPRELINQCSQFLVRLSSFLKFGLVLLNDGLDNLVIGLRQ